MAKEKFVPDQAARERGDDRSHRPRQDDADGGAREGAVEEGPGEGHQLPDIAKGGTVRDDDQDGDDWNTPFFLSAHSASTLYIGGNRVLKSIDRGDDLFPISPDLSTRDIAKIRCQHAHHGRDHQRCHRRRDVLHGHDVGGVPTCAPGCCIAGTDDGNVWLTRNDGGQWENLTGASPGVPPRTYVSAHRAVALRFVHLLRGVRQPSGQRLRAVSLRDHRFRQDVPLAGGQSAHRWHRTSCT